MESSFSVFIFLLYAKLESYIHLSFIISRLDKPLLVG